MKNRSSILFFSIVLLIPFAAFALFSLYEKNWKPLPVYEKGRTVQNFVFTNQDNQTFTSARWNNKIVIVNFFFTHCPTICPTMIKNFQYLQAKLQSNESVILTSFTVDPENDSPERLKKYCQERKINTHKWHLLTGDKKEIYKLARNSFKLVATDGDGGSDDFIHSEKFILLDRRQRIRGYYDGTSKEETDQLMYDIKKIQNEN